MQCATFFLLTAYVSLIYYKKYRSGYFTGRRERQNITTYRCIF